MEYRELIDRGDQLFSKRSMLMSLWQEIGDNFYVERADFTTTRMLGTDYAGHLTSSYPLLVRRDLGDSISAILRPSGESWMEVGVDRDDMLQNADRKWLEMATKTQTNVQYDRHSGFVNATKMCDHDWATFGNGVISIDVDWSKMTLIHRCWHLRDVAWADDDAGDFNEVHRNWKVRPCDLQRMFKGNVDPRVIERGKTEPFCEINCRHVVMEAEYYKDGKVKDKWVSLVIDLDNKKIMEEIYRPWTGYIIPRWKRIGSQYAVSPATTIALPDARLIQSMALSIMEAGEMSVRPPLIGMNDALREDVQYFAGGITKADVEDDRALKDVLAPIFQDRSGFNFGLEVMKDTRDLIATALYINKLTLPPMGHAMTAFETSARLAEHARQTLPLFEPLEPEYSFAMCDMQFQMLMKVGAFGPPQDIPPNLRRQNVKFKFTNPLQQASDQKKGAQWQQTLQLTGETIQLAPNASLLIDPIAGLRDALNGIGASPTWLRDEDAVANDIAQRQQRQEIAQQTAQAQQGGQAMQQVGKGAQELQKVRGAQALQQATGSVQNLSAA